MYRAYGYFAFRRWLWLALGMLALLAVLLAGLGACAVHYEKDGGYTGALACVDVSVAGVFTWKCVEQSQVPTLPDGPQPETSGQ